MTFRIRRCRTTSFILTTVRSLLSQKTAAVIAAAIIATATLQVLQVASAATLVNADEGINFDEKKNDTRSSVSSGCPVGTGFVNGVSNLTLQVRQGAGSSDKNLVNFRAIFSKDTGALTSLWAGQRLLSGGSRGFTT